MADVTYRDFDLHIERAGEGFSVEVVNSPAGQASAEFVLPFAPVQLENLVLRLSRTRRGVRRVESSEMQAAKEFGTALFQAVFTGEVRACLRSSLDEAKREGSNLRIRLHVTDAELSNLPWEYLYYKDRDQFLALSIRTPLVRYLDLPDRIPALAIAPPLRILVMISSPDDYPTLEVEREWKLLNEALTELGGGRVTCERMDDATLPALQQRLRRNQYHIFHFIGHGGYDQDSEEGVLILEDEHNKGQRVSSRYLGMLLHDHTPLRVAVLNACEGARSSTTDPFAGTAQTLVRQGLPAVIAMQFEIADDVAMRFAKEFYGAVADGYPVDAAVTESRKAIFAMGRDVEWGTPVLYMRAPDGHIFDIAQKPPERVAPPAAAQPGPRDIIERVGAIASSRARVEWHLAQGELEVAEAALLDAQRAFPGERELDEVRAKIEGAKQARVAEHHRLAVAAVEEAERQFGEGRHAAAVAMLEAFTPPHEAVARAIARFRTRIQELEWERIEKERRAADAERARRELDAQVRRAEDCLNRRNLAEARRLVEAVLETSPDHDAARALLDRVDLALAHREADARRAEEHRRREREIGELIDRADGLSDHEEALVVLRLGLDLDPEHPRLLDRVAKREADQAHERDDAERIARDRREEERHRQEAQRREREAERQRMAEVEALERQQRELARRQAELADLLLSAQELAHRGRYSRALREVAKVLARDPKSAEALSLKQSILESIRREPAPVPLLARGARVISRPAVYLALAAVLVVAAGLWIWPRAEQWMRTRLTPAPLVTTSRPAPTSPATTASTTKPARTPPVAENIPETPASEAPDAEPVATGVSEVDRKRADAQEQRIRRQWQAGHRQLAVQNALEALREFPKHAGLTSFIATAASQAWTFATQARARAEAAGNDVMLSPGYQEGLRRFEEANRLQRAGRPADAAPGYLSAASQFERAKRDAQQQVAVNARPAGANPSSSAPASKPADVVARDDRAPVAPPAPAPPEPERKSAEPERKITPSERPAEAPAPAPRQPANTDTPPASASATTPTREQSAATISRMLKAYEAAFNSRDVQSLRAIWPGVPDDFFARLTKQMGDIKALSIGLNGCQVTTKGTTGSVTCRETGVAVDRFGRPHAIPDRPRSFDVQSTGSGWIITARR